MTVVAYSAATIVAGASQGIAISAATRGLLHGSTPADRAPVFSAIYLLSYSGATIPALIAGRLSNTFPLPQIALGYGALALVATVFTVIAGHDRAHTRALASRGRRGTRSASPRSRRQKTGRGARRSKARAHAGPADAPL
jgi:hypothetical protein